MSGTTERTMAEAINLALEQALEDDESVVLLGQDVGVNGGVFRITENLQDRFGAERVIDTPLAESGIVGVSVGMCVAGLKPIPELQFSGFSYLAFHQIESHVSRFRWRSQGGFPMPMVVRMPWGGGIHALEHHSESREVFYTHMPGIKVVVPSTPRDARALLAAAIADPDPVVFLEPKVLYRSFREEVPDDRETATIGEPAIRRDGSDLTVVSYGAMAHRATEACDRLADEDGVETTIIDLRTLSPLDHGPVVESLRKTGRLMIIHEAPRSYGPAAEIASRVMEDAFLYLEAPINRVTGFDTHMPYFAREQDYLPSADRIVAEARETLAF